MRLDADEARRLVDFFQEPVFVVRRSGRIDAANASARTKLGCDPAGRHLSEFTTNPEDLLKAYLKRCAGSGSPVVGSIVLRSATGEEEPFQAKGALLSRQQDRALDRVVLRCTTAGRQAFNSLSRQIEDLNRENRRQRHDRAVLKEAVAHRDLLLRELQHRVRNHTQLIHGMITAAQRSAESDELLAFLDSLKRRLTAIGSVQQLMYMSEQLQTVSAPELIENLCRPTAESWPSGTELTFSSIDVDLPNDTAVPLALIINELLSNAVKHGLKYASGKAKVELTADQDELVLTVWDSGPGFTSTETGRRHSSGMGLVRGLCRQIGGSFSATSSSGTFCTIRFPRTGS